MSSLPKGSTLVNNTLTFTDNSEEFKIYKYKSFFNSKNISIATMGGNDTIDAYHPGKERDSDGSTDIQLYVGDGNDIVEFGPTSYGDTYYVHGGSGLDQIMLVNWTNIKAENNAINLTIPGLGSSPNPSKVVNHNDVEILFNAINNSYLIVDDLLNGIQRHLNEDEIIEYKSSFVDSSQENIDNNVIEIPDLANNRPISSLIGRLYTAAFGRVPDEGGLQYWVNEVNDPLVSYKDVSQNFVNSPEFSAMASPNSSSDVFATALYQNVLGRAPDSSGLGYWTNQLNSGLQDRADILIGFAESPENVALYETLV